MDDARPDLFHHLLVADLAIEKGADPESVGSAMARFWEKGDRSGIEALRASVAEDVEEALAHAKGDPRLALAARGGAHRSLVSSLPVLSRGGLRARAELRRMDPDRYVDFEPLGEGGMGVVYLAFDTHLNRDVAFKMGRTGAGADPRSEVELPVESALYARFVQEACVTGGLAHPGVVPVYEIGRTWSGAPYYTMGVVRGERTLEDAVREARGLEDRLALVEAFLKTCDTVRYAHERGVVHRDLKPANIALGKYGETVVLDWGLAKVKEQPDLAESRWHEQLQRLRSETHLQTMTGALGTPGFMSPEALAGELDRVDERSDVYSLGATLYRVLTGRTPYGNIGLVELAEAIEKELPPPPREVDPAVPKGLSLVCMKALAIDPDRRYANAGEMADAVRRWQRESALDREIDAMLAEAASGLEALRTLEGDALLGQVDRVLAVTARILELRPGQEAAARIEAQARTRRAAAIEVQARTARRRLLARVGAVTLAVAAAVAVLVAVVIESKRREAEEARAREQVARERAEDLSDFMLVDLRDKLQPLGRLDLLGAVARKSLDYQRSMPTRDVSAEALRERGIAFGNLGDVLWSGGDGDAALDSFREGLAIARQLVASDPDDPVRARDLAIGLERVGDLLLARGEVEAAETSLDESLALKVRLARSDPGSEELSRDLANGHDRIARLATQRGDLDAALDSYRASLKIREDRLRAEPDDAEWQREVSVSLNAIADIHAFRDDVEAALETYERSLVIRRRLVASDPEDADGQRDLIVPLTAIGTLLLARGEIEAAGRSFRECLDVSSRLAERDPTNAVWQRDLSVGLDRVAHVHALSGETDVALERYGESLAIRERLASADPANLDAQRDLGVSHEYIGRVHRDRGDLPAAVASLGRSLEIARRLAASDPENVSLARDVYVTLASLAGVHEMAGAFDAATRSMGEAVALCEAQTAKAPHLGRELDILRAEQRRLSLLVGRDAAK